MSASQVTAQSFVEQKFILDMANLLTPCPDTDDQYCSPLQRSTAFAYDAVMMVANAIVAAKGKCVNVSPGVYGNATLGGAMMSALRNVSFSGASGPISFASGSNDRLTSNVRHRLKTIGYSLSKYIVLSASFFFFSSPPHIIFTSLLYACVKCLFSSLAQALPIYNIQQIQFLSTYVAKITQDGAVDFTGGTPILWQGQAIAGGVAPTFQTYYVGLIAQTPNALLNLRLALKYINRFDGTLGAGSGDALLAPSDMIFTQPLPYVASPELQNVQSLFSRVSLGQQSNMTSPVIAIVGGVSSTFSGTLGQLAASLALPVIDGIAQSSILSDASKYPFWVRTQSSTATIGISICSFLSTMGWRALSIIYEPVPYGIGGAQDVTNSAISAGMLVRTSTPYDGLNITNARAIMSTLLQLFGPKQVVVMFVNTGPCQSDILQAGAELGMVSPNVVYVFTQSLKGGFANEAVVAAAKYSILMTQTSDKTLPEYSKFAARYDAEFGTPSEPSTAYFPFLYDAVYLLAEAIRQMKSAGKPASAIPNSRLELMAAIRSARVQGATGPVFHPSVGPVQNDRLGNPRPYYYFYSGNGNNSQSDVTFGYANANFTVDVNSFLLPLVFPTALFSSTTTNDIPGAWNHILICTFIPEMA